MKNEEILEKVKKDLGPDNGIEIISKRGKREKHFLQKDGTIIAKMYSNDVHFKKNGKYEEINNTLEKDGEYYHNKNNSFKANFKETSDADFLIYEYKSSLLSLTLFESNKSKAKVIKCDNKYLGKILYEDMLDGIDFEYSITPTKVKEKIIIKEKRFLKEKITFMLKTNLHIKINSKNDVIVIKDGKTLFTFDAPYILDSNNNHIDNVLYELNSFKDGYTLSIVLNKNELLKDDISYPIIVDPTISTYDLGNVYDTYIYPGDTNVNRNAQDILKVGVEKINGADRINRTLLKFDLPKISTGSQIVYAKLDLVGYPYYDNLYNGTKYIDIHRITTSWDESTATWESMNDKYDSRIENCFTFVKGCIELQDGEYWQPRAGADITEIVKKWYSDLNNYGIMLKAHNEVYNEELLPTFYSKDNHISGDNPKPELTVVYRNYSGIEEYLKYKNQTISIGKIYENLYNGNITGLFNIGNTISSKLPISLDLIYNTNDVIAENNYGYGLGFKLNMYQTIKASNIDGYLEYFDETGRIHYFTQNESNNYYDEENLGLVIKQIPNESTYELSDKKGNVLIFSLNTGEGLYRLTKFIDIYKNSILVSYNSDGKICMLKDNDNNQLTIEYYDNYIRVISSQNTIELNYVNGVLEHISEGNNIIYFNYNSNHLIEKIIDSDNTSIELLYYDKEPYRIKKVIQHGIGNEEGPYFSLEYQNNVTKLKDNKNRITHVNFNANGNANSFCFFNEEDNINGAYASINEYGEYDEYKNKILYSKIPFRHVKNYLSNISFEGTSINFEKSIDNISFEISNEVANSGFNSFKVQSVQESNIFQKVNVPKDNNYTFSFYIKNNKTVQAAIGYFDNTGIFIENRVNIFNETEFKRHDVTIDYPLNSTSELYIKFYMEENTIMYIDDIQLEEGEVANNFNYIENSDFSNGFNGWTLQSGDNNLNRFQIANLNHNVVAAKIVMDPDNWTNLHKEYNIKGHSGDKYTLSFWYKNNGIATDHYITALIGFNTVEPEYGHCIEPIQLNNCENTWQYFTVDYAAEADYSEVYVDLSQDANANELYITNISLFKDINQNSYNYDSKGNLNKINDLSNNYSEMKYDNNNQLNQIITPIGKNLYFEYGNESNRLLLNTISTTGISNKVVYDSDGMPIYSNSKNSYLSTDFENTPVIIRHKGTNLYLKNNHGVLKLVNNCSIDKWTFEIIDEQYYKIHHSILYNKYLSVDNNSLIISSYMEDKSQFQLIKNDNGSYLVKIKNTEKYLKYDNNELVVEYWNSEDDYKYEFYLEKEDSDFIEESVTYDNNKFINSIGDSNMNVTSYEYNNVTGLIKSITNSKGFSKHYYFDNEKIRKISFYDQIIDFIYNENNMIESIVEGMRKYSFTYDNFLNIKTVKVGDNIPLITNNYELNNGNLESLEYGNGNRISYTYDEFDRIKSIQRMDGIFNLKYGNNGDLLKIVSDEYIEKYTYTKGKLLKEYSIGGFIIRYDYDKMGNQISVNYILNNMSEILNFEFNDENSLKNVLYNNDIINYRRDNLNRIISKKIGDILQSNVIYKYNGKRTSSLIKEFNNGINNYTYKYDKLDNITHIYCDGILTNRYYYDKYNRLIKEHNYNLNYTIKYKYDHLGNLINRIYYKLNTYEYISRDLYTRSNNLWPDQLTEYNNQSFVYDEIGNPIRINNKVLSWINGRQLSEYNDGINNIKYKYDVDGVRISKIKNNIETKYYLDDDDIIFEETNGNILFFLRNDVEDLFGFKYNDNLYYYIKNGQDDITGIVNEQGNLVARYEYDSWGKIISVVDALGNDISNNLTHIANINPYRYKGYYYDIDTKLYYLNDRYYNPETATFLNADGIIGSSDGILNYNLYNYSNNNPINYSDIDGNYVGALTNPYVAGILLVGGLLLYAASRTVDSSAVAGAIGSLVSGSSSSKSKKNKKTSNKSKTKTKTKTQTKTTTKTQTKSITAASVSSTTKKTKKEEHYVYRLTDNNDVTIYVGRTVNPDVRKAAHGRDFKRKRNVLNFELLEGPVSRNEARGLEQAYILLYESLNKENPAANQINGVRWDNINCNDYMNSVLTFLPENEIYVGYCK